MNKYINKLMSQYPQLSRSGAETIVGYVNEVLIDHLQTTEIPGTLSNTFYMKCCGVVDMNGIMAFESYSENGLSATIDKSFITRGIVGSVRTPK